MTRYLVRVIVEPSRRERKKLATRDALQRAAMDLVEERGLSCVTVEDITERADVAPRTFFNYFSTKEDAVIGREPDYVESLVEALRACPADEPVFDSLRRVMTDRFVAREEDPVDLLRRIRVVQSAPQLLSRMAAQFEQLEQGLIAEVAARSGHDPLRDLDSAVLVSASLAGCRAALMHWCNQGGRHSIERSLDEMFTRLAAGLADVGVSNHTQREDIEQKVQV